MSVPAKSVPAMSVPGQEPNAAAIEPSLTRRNLMRAGYLLMAVGLALVKWPLLPGARELPLYEGVTVCLLTALSLLALLGLRHPVKLLPVLVFETVWKLLWLSIVALPQALAGTMDAATTEVMVNCSLVIVYLVVTPWRFVWRSYIVATGDRWRRSFATYAATTPASSTRAAERDSESLGKQRERLDVTRPHRGEVSSVKSGDLRDAQSLRNSDD